MQSSGLLFVAVGIIASAVGSAWLVVAAFKENILWGLGCLFLPFVALFFHIGHWEDAATPFGVSLGGCLLSELSTSNSSAS